MTLIPLIIDADGRPHHIGGVFFYGMMGKRKGRRMNALFGIMMGFIFNESIQSRNYYTATCAVIAVITHLIIVYWH